MESMMKKLKQKLRSGSSSKIDEENLFLENGGMFLEKLISDCNYESIPIRNFSSSQIRKATNNFDSSCLVHDYWYFKWYKSIIEDKPYLIKRYVWVVEGGDAFNDIVLSARMSTHNNFLKLMGCCFEFRYPVFLFEYDEHVIVNDKGRIMVNGKESILPWSVRLNIAKEVAIAVTYLHMAFPRIIIHKDIKADCIFLDKNLKAKLTHFKLAVSLPQGKSRIQDENVYGTVGYTDPLYFKTASLSEYTNVYSFGMCLLVFLTGKPAYDFAKKCSLYGIIEFLVKNPEYSHEKEKLDEVIDPMIVKDITSGQRLQVEACVRLALRCCNKVREEDRPKMIQVAKELKRIQQLEQSLDVSSAIGFPKA